MLTSSPTILLIINLYPEVTLYGNRKKILNRKTAERYRRILIPPVIRVRKEDDHYYMTYKGSGMMAREEYNLPLNKTAYEQLKSKAEGNIISKKRVLIPYSKYTIELDIFEAPFAPLLLAEVEFESEEDANAFTPPDWFGQDVTYDGKYHNSNMSRAKL